MISLSKIVFIKYLTFKLKLRLIKWWQLKSYRIEAKCFWTMVQEFQRGISSPSLQIDLDKPPDRRQSTLENPESIGSLLKVIKIVLDENASLKMKIMELEAGKPKEIQRDDKVTSVDDTEYKMKTDYRKSSYAEICRKKVNSSHDAELKQDKQERDSYSKVRRNEFKELNIHAHHRCCSYCGIHHREGIHHCSAYGKICHRCSKKNHFRRTCRTRVWNIKSTGRNGKEERCQEINIDVDKVGCNSSKDWKPYEKPSYDRSYCNYCKKEGHDWNRCYKRQEDEKTKQSQRNGRRRYNHPHARINAMDNEDKKKAP